MPQTDPIPQRKFFLCSGELVNEDKLHQFKNLHILGELRLRKNVETGRTVGMLAVYREALPTDRVALIRPRISNFTYHSHVLCSLCERAPRWNISHSAFMTLMEHYGVSTLEG